MSKQLLFYESAVPVSPARHADASVETGTGYAFASHASAVPLMALEFVPAAAEYAIVFAPAGDEVFPAVVLGLRSEQNLYLGPSAEWGARYVPAFVRRYPFVFSASADRKTLVLCIDEACAGLNRQGRGERLFDEQRQPTAYTQGVLRFLQDFQSHFQRTRAFCQRLKALGVLEPTRVQVQGPGGEKLGAGGFLVVDRRKLRELPDEKLLALAKSDELELLHLHLYSLRNFAAMKDRMADATRREHEGAETPTTLQ